MSSAIQSTWQRARQAAAVPSSGTGIILPMSHCSVRQVSLNPLDQETKAETCLASLPQADGQ